MYPATMNSYNPYGQQYPQQQQQYTPYGMYGQNPHYALAETPYSRMTGQFTQLSEAMIPGMQSMLQPVFVDMNPYFGNSGIPRYPSFIGPTAMQNPQIPLMQPGQQQYIPQQQQYYQPQQQQYYQPQQQIYAMQPHEQPAPAPAPEAQNPFAGLEQLVNQFMEMFNL